MPNPDSDGFACTLGDAVSVAHVAKFLPKIVCGWSEGGMTDLVRTVRQFGS